MSMITLGELLARFDGNSSHNTKVIFSVDGDYDTGNRVRDYSDEYLEKEIDSWSAEFVEFHSVGLNYEAVINVKVWVK